VTTDVELVVSLEDYEHPQAVAERAIEAERLGFCGLTVGETTGWNVVPALTLAAERTDDLGISTTAVSPFGRSPAMLAQTALALQAVADDRFRLGIGPSSPAITERWHGASFDRPLRRTRETIGIIRAVYERGNPAYEGDIFDISGLGYERDVPDNPPPIDVATLGPKATELAGRFGDGWTPQLFTRDGLQDRLTDLERGADLAGVDPAELRVAPIVRGMASEDGEIAREKTRKTVAFMLGAYGPYYGNSVTAQGYPDVVTDVRAAWADRDTDAMAAALPDDVLDELAPAGTPEEVTAWIDSYSALEGVDVVRVGFVDGMTEAEKRATMEAVVDAV